MRIYAQVSAKLSETSHWGRFDAYRTKGIEGQRGFARQGWYPDWGHSFEHGMTVLSLDQDLSRMTRIAHLTLQPTDMGARPRRGEHLPVLRGDVNTGVTCSTKRYQVVFCIRTRLTAETYVVNL